uniref:Uncharacterized protein n=1 Tax=Timema tahoe TaxID=61484 RepID=A0A7R9NZZ4_9NEOP|nr:unnamed protein product [Timema tahoe]
MPTSSKKQVEDITFTTQYHPGLQRINTILKSGYKFLTSFSQTQNLLSSPPRVTFKQPPNLHNILVYPKFPDPRRIREEKSTTEGTPAVAPVEAHRKSKSNRATVEVVITLTGGLTSLPRIGVEAPRGDVEDPLSHEAAKEVAEEVVGAGVVVVQHQQSPHGMRLGMLETETGKEVVGGHIITQRTGTLVMQPQRLGWV